MHLEQLRIFAEVVRSGGFSKAAEHLNVSKGFVSQQIKQLEIALGKSLLLRNTRNMRLTSSGELVYEQALKLTSFWTDTKDLLNQTEDSLRGEVKCTAPVAVAQYWLWPRVETLLTNQPDITLIVDSGNVAHNLVEKNYDFALRLTNTPPEDMVARKLFEVDYICCCSPDYAQKTDLPENPVDLKHHSVVALNHWKNWRFNLSEEQLEIELKPKLAASDNELLKSACLNGLGIGRFPSYMVSTEIEQGTLIPVLTTFIGESRGLYLIYPAMSARPARVQLVLDSLCQ